MNIYCDSGLKECCIVIEGQDPIVMAYDEPVTVNVGEYTALLYALGIARAIRFSSLPRGERISFFSDSQVVVKQVNGEWRCRKQHLIPLLEEAKKLMKPLRATLTWVPREKNLAGLVLE